MAGWHWLPNAITLLRILASVPLAWAILGAHLELALAIAVVAGASDALDGWLAKRHGWQTRLGSLLDPIADKLLLIAAFVALALIGALPAWLVVLVLARDAIIVIGAIAWHNLVGPVEGRPTRLSKVTTFVQIVLVVMTLVAAHPGKWIPDPVVAFFIALTAALTLASGLHYVLVWSRRALAARRGRAH